MPEEACETVPGANQATKTSSHGLLEDHQRADVSACHQASVEHRKTRESLLLSPARFSQVTEATEVTQVTEQADDENVLCDAGTQTTFSMCSV